MSVISPISTDIPRQEGLLPLYDRLRRLAGRFLDRERVDHTLQPTALVHEAYLRIVRDKRFQSMECPRAMSIAARVMRDVLVDHARRKQACKRGGNWERHPLDSTFLQYESRSIDLIALDDALAKLAGIDTQAATIVELRFFGGLTEEDIALVMNTSTRTVRRGWRAAKIWLARELEPDVSK